MKEKKLKVYTIGGWNDGHWIDNTKKAESYDEADIIIFPGGNDIAPELYGEKASMFTQSPIYKRDDKEIYFYNRAVKDGKFIIGICRGNQLLTVLNGGKLIQHVTHHHQSHTCKTIDGKPIYTNSIHHQMAYPWNMDKRDYKLIAWTEGISEIYLNGENTDVEFPTEAFNEGKVIEPEIIYFPNTKCLGIQFHP